MASVKIEELIKIGHHLRQGFMPDDLRAKVTVTLSTHEAIDLHREMREAWLYRRRYIPPMGNLTTVAEEVSSFSYLDKFIDAEPAPANPPSEGYWGFFYGVKVYVSG